MNNSFRFLLKRTRVNHLLVFLLFNIIIQILFYFEYNQDLKNGSDIVEFCFSPLLTTVQLFASVVYCVFQTENYFNKSLFHNLYLFGLNKLDFSKSFIIESLLISLSVIIIKLLNLFFLTFILKISLELHNYYDIMIFGIVYFICSSMIINIGTILSFVLKSAMKGLAIFYVFQFIEKVLIKLASKTKYNSLIELFPFSLKDSLLNNPNQIMHLLLVFLYLLILVTLHIRFIKKNHFL